ncbi:hypothetical protein BSQ39_08280 [Loigolactobacillus backii]|uniref:DnaD domain-containing protein n=1 Tax=Loigolactobacillus backii TaxID=375175 RepID=UPI000C1CA05A|nr:DnaD domain protein [Loigolactobacillus backii]PIO83560.1 hypothetical protein BSQ39_08280 [Loigolactobacillus backii]
MDYLKQILAFNDRLLFNSSLSSGQIALWYALMSINNKTRWADWFSAANQTLESLSGLSRQGIVKARNIRKQEGLVEFETNGRKATSYHLCTLYTSNSRQESGTKVALKLPNSSAMVAEQLPNGSTLLKHKQKGKDKGKDKGKQNNSDVVAVNSQNYQSIELWENLWGFPNAVAREDLSHWIDDFGDDLVCFAIKYAAKRNVKARSADKYLERIFTGYSEQKIDTVAKAEAALLKHQQTMRSNYSGKQARTETLPEYAQDNYVPPKEKVTPEQQAELDKGLADLRALRSGTGGE